MLTLNQHKTTVLEQLRNNNNFQFFPCWLCGATQNCTAIHSPKALSIIFLDVKVVIQFGESYVLCLVSGFMNSNLWSSSHAIQLYIKTKLWLHIYITIFTLKHVAVITNVAFTLPKGKHCLLGGEQTTTIRLVLQILPLTCTYTHSHFPI